MNTQVTPSLPYSTPRPSPQTLLQLADQCVKCGYCLPHCPTYASTRSEADSPRGRIALIQGWLTGQLAMTPHLAAHLDGCLLCRACESVCPSLVAYGQLMDGARAQQMQETSAWRRRVIQSAVQMLSDARVLDMLGRFARRSVASGLAHLSERTRLASVHRLLKALAITARSPASPTPTAVTDLDLFVGCSGASLQGAALNATLALCERLGQRARLAPEAVCCGAMLRHNGFPDAADRARDRCVQVHGGRPLIGISSACVAELREHPELTATLEVCDYLDRQPWPETLQLRPLARRVLVHEPCSQRRLPGGAAAVYRLLARIPELAVAPLPENDRCCGAAGTYLLQHPAQAAVLLEAKLHHLRRLQPDVVVTTNPGCALHLLAGIQASGLMIEVCHPVELLVRQLPPLSTELF